MPEHPGEKRPARTGSEIMVASDTAIYHELANEDYACHNVQIGYHHILFPVSSSHEVRSLCIDLLIQGTLMAVQIPAQTKGTPHPNFISSVHSKWC
jgi:hypothetical protein